MIESRVSSAMDWIVRPASEADADVIISFQLQMAMESEGLELDCSKLEQGVRAALSDPSKGEYLLVSKQTDNGMTVVGSLMLTYEWSDWNNCRYMWIQSVFIRPEYRRQGTYRALYSKAGEMAKTAGISQIRLYVDQSNTAGIQTYKALGMKQSHYLMFEASV